MERINWISWSFAWSYQCNFSSSVLCWCACFCCHFLINFVLFFKLIKTNLLLISCDLARFLLQTNWVLEYDKCKKEIQPSSSEYDYNHWNQTAGVHVRRHPCLYVTLDYLRVEHILCLFFLNFEPLQNTIHIREADANTPSPPPIPRGRQRVQTCHFLLLLKNVVILKKPRACSCRGLTLDLLHCAMKLESL